MSTAVYSQLLADAIKRINVLENENLTLKQTLKEIADMRYSNTSAAAIADQKLNEKRKSK